MTGPFADRLARIALQAGRRDEREPRPGGVPRLKMTVGFGLMATFGVGWILEASGLRGALESGEALVTPVSVGRAIVPSGMRVVSLRAGPNVGVALPKRTSMHEIRCPSCRLRLWLYQGMRRDVPPPLDCPSCHAMIDRGEVAAARLAARIDADHRDGARGPAGSVGCRVHVGRDASG